MQEKLQPHDRHLRRRRAAEGVPNPVERNNIANTQLRVLNVKRFKKRLTQVCYFWIFGEIIIPLQTQNAEIAQLVEHNLAKVGVAGPSPVFRS